MMMSMPRATCRRPRGFSLIELLLAIFILGVGIISVASVFPAGIIQQRRTQDDVLGPVVAEAALATIRSKVSQSDFGTFEEFGISGSGAFVLLDQGFPDSWLDAADAYTQIGDWPWLRPSMAAVPLNASTSQWPLYAGDIDIFSARVARASPFVTRDYPSSMQWDQNWRTTELGLSGGGFPTFGQGYDDNPDEGDPGAFLFGIPFNRSRFDFFDNGEDPLVTIKQEERFWPLGTGFDRDRHSERPQFAWDCMFRRFQGRVQVAIFVYRLKIGNSLGGYAVCQDAGSAVAQRQYYRPPMPARVDLDDSIGLPPWSPFGADPVDCDPGEPGVTQPRDYNIVPGTCPDFTSPNNLLALDPYFEGWQAPGQWLLDPYGRLHRVLQGRRNKRQGPVRLARPAQSQVPSATLVAPANAQDAADWQGLVDEVRSIWFIPTSDRRGITLEPIYVTVRDL